MLENHDLSGAGKLANKFSTSFAGYCLKRGGDILTRSQVPDRRQDAFASNGARSQTSDSPQDQRPVQFQ
jgi:hypothetical protein